MLTLPAIEEEKIQFELTKDASQFCTVCQGESGISFPFGDHTCSHFAGVNDERAGFVTFNSQDLYSIYKGLRRI